MFFISFLKNVRAKTKRALSFYTPSHTEPHRATLTHQSHIEGYKKVVSQITDIQHQINIYTILYRK